MVYFYSGLWCVFTPALTNMFRRLHDNNLLEIAEITSVGTDAYGIPHVRFNVTFSRPDRYACEEGSRMLALRSFAERYRERVSP